MSKKWLMLVVPRHSVRPLNTEIFKRFAGGDKAKKVGMGAYRVGMAGAVAWLYLHFATVKDLDLLREWVRRLSESRSAQFQTIDARQDIVEQRQAYIEGRLGFPLHIVPSTVKTNQP